jgi:hypothetical protein
VSVSDDVHARFKNALDAFVERVRGDDKIVAAILFGSLSYDAVWEYSDIDVYLVCKDEKRPIEGYCLVEHGINIHALLFPRARFRQMLDGAAQGSFFHSTVVRGTLLFSRDDALSEAYENARHLGEKDREIQLLHVATCLLPALVKAEKWLTVKHDPDYCFVWLMHVVVGLAQMDVLMHGEIPGREVIHQALQTNPELFRAVYTDLIRGEKTPERMRDALNRIADYLDSHIRTLFKPILDYLEREGVARTTRQLDEHFSKRLRADSLAVAYEWLADKDVLMKVGVPLRLTETSRVTVEEAAYLYEGDDE